MSLSAVPPSRRNPIGNLAPQRSALACCGVLPLSPNDDRIRLAVYRAIYGHSGDSAETTPATASAATVRTDSSFMFHLLLRASVPRVDWHFSATGGRTEDRPTASPNRQGGGTLSGAPHYQPGGRSGLCPARAVHQASPAAVPVQLGIRGEHGRAPSRPPKKDHFGFVPNRSARP
jgi:hypothetical protein